MESTLLVIIGIIVLLLVLSLVFKGIGFVLKIITNPKVLLFALILCAAVFFINRMMS